MENLSLGIRKNKRPRTLVISRRSQKLKPERRAVSSSEWRRYNAIVKIAKIEAQYWHLSITEILMSDLYVV